MATAGGVSEQLVDIVDFGDSVVLRVGKRRYTRMLLPCPVLITQVIPKEGRYTLTSASKLILLREVVDE